jgi:hypothetical protein
LISYSATEITVVVLSPVLTFPAGKTPILEVSPPPPSLSELKPVRMEGPSHSFFSRWYWFALTCPNLCLCHCFHGWLTMLAACFALLLFCVIFGGCELLINYLCCILFGPEVGGRRIHQSCGKFLPFNWVSHPCCENPKSHKKYVAFFFM